MRIAYVTSEIRMGSTFVINEMEAHRQAGWSILPLASCKRSLNRRFSHLITQWAEKAVFRPSLLVQIWSTLRVMVKQPICFLKICSWLTYLALHSLLEFTKALYELPAACYFESHCRKFKVQHIHVHFASRSLSLGLMMGMLIKVPVSCTVHAFDIFTRSPNSLIPRLSECRFIASVSNYNIEYLRQACGERIASLCHVVHCGVDVNKFASTKCQTKPGHLICIANLVSKKGHEVAIRACAKLSEEQVNFVFKIVGEGPMRHNLEELIRSLNLSDNIKLLGVIPNDQLVPLLRESCALISPNIIDPSGLRDGIPVAMMEAMACQVPVISTYISGIPELVQDGVNGYLVPERDVDALALSIKKVLANMDLVKRFGQVGREWVQQHFNIVNTAAQIRKLIVGQ